eukprot:TRINITY_DN2342_c0_g1_i3.p1 TRINITY_DN2342_c0_g1~~TRINITY_DN2342_c0_g1_i3.p1  ORF type:complete len:249 (-),score=44.88 TRINITY_DN2342_c0_g1_i3:238-984(-)
MAWVWWLAVLLALAPAVSADCNSCCVATNASCNAAYNGGPGKCCGRDATSRPFCCPSNAYCVPGSSPAFSCSLNPPPTSDCSACCSGGSCSTAYKGTPGKCCGKVMDTSYCCPVNSAICVRSQTFGTYACEATGANPSTLSTTTIVVIVVAAVVFFIIAGVLVSCFCGNASSSTTYYSSGSGYYQSSDSGDGFVAGLIVGSSMSHNHQSDSGWSGGNFFSADTGSSSSFAADSGSSFAADSGGTFAAD